MHAIASVLRILALLLIEGDLVGRRSGALAADDEACPAAGGGGAGCELKRKEDEANSKCVKWRQTGGCNPIGPRERHGDKACHEEIEAGSSGYCQCGPTNLPDNQKIKARQVTCDHRPFSCATECLQYRRYTCLGWRQTGGCSADGAREANNDKSCSEKINARSSGFCECGDGRVIRKPGCEHGEYSDSFTCLDLCAGEPDLYEELGVDSGATEKDVKSAFRKLSLKYHPDKTRNNPVMSARFHAIREAYDIISDPEKRSLYDVSGIKMVYEAKNQKVEKGPSMNGDIEITLDAFYNGEESYRAVQRKAICRGCRDSSSEACRKCKTQCANEVEIRQVQMGPMRMNQQVEVKSKEKCRMENVKLFVTVERGMASGDTVVFKSQGEQQPKKIPGDVVLKLKQTEHQLFKRVGVDLHVEVEISLQEALLGFDRSITHMDGRKLMLAYTGVTKPFGVMRIDGEGMPHKGDPTQMGNLFVKFRVVMPEDGRKWLTESCASKQR